MNNFYIELIQLLRDKIFLSSMLLLLVVMSLASLNAYVYYQEKVKQISEQIDVVQKFDQNLINEIDSLNNGLADYRSSYTLPTNGVRLTYNNHRVTTLPIKPMSILSIGQSDLFSNYKKIILYFNDSYEMSTNEIVSPIEQLFGQLDLSFIWVYLLPLIIIIVSFNILSQERETGRLSLIASQPIKISHWVFKKILIRFLAVYLTVFFITLLILLMFNIDLIENFDQFLLLSLFLLLYSSFWFLLCFIINLTGFSSSQSLIVLTGIWVFLIFVIPSIVNQIAKETHPIPSRLEIINHHQKMYNEIEANLEEEKEKLFVTHSAWQSDDPMTKDLSNSTGWNIDFLAKQYIAQLKHRPVYEAYEQKIDARNLWLNKFRIFSPGMIFQLALSDMAGSSSSYYRSFLRQSLDYSEDYRAYVFQKLFTNHKFSVEDINSLSVFEFNENKINNQIPISILSLAIYLFLLIIISIAFKNKSLIIIHSN